jgi:hypothetical protein
MITRALFTELLIEFFFDNCRVIEPYGLISSLQKNKQGIKILLSLVKTIENFELII